ncbi:MAG: glycosyltransferase [Clostridia bacterium]|nr:glycosyltransferase [Clostridia bacterium]
MKLSVVIPTYNEESAVKNTADELVDALDGYLGAQIDAYEVIFSNDGSTDSTARIVGEIAGRDKYRFVRLVGSEVNRGKGAAVRRGVLASEGDLVLYTDCDLAYGTDVIGEALALFRKTGADAVIGSRAIHPRGYEGYTMIRKAASKIYLRTLARYAGFSLSDSQCGFKAFRGDFCREIFSSCTTDGWSFDFELLMRAEKAGAKIEELPVAVLRHGNSRIRLVGDSLKMLRDVRRLKKTLAEEEKAGQA